MRVKGLFTHFDEDGDKLSINNLLDGGFTVNRNEFSDSDDSSVFDFDVFVMNVRDKFGKLIHGILLFD